MAKLKDDMPRLLVEAVLIVFSVLLALGLNAWWQQRQDQQLAEMTRVSFAEEICMNLRAVEESAPYHEAVSEALAEYLAGDAISSQTFFDILMQAAPRGLQPPGLRDTAWQAAIASGAMRLLDAEVVYEMADVYAVQASGVRSTWPQMIRSISRPEAFQPSMKRHVVEFLKLSFSELASQEHYLGDVYRGALGRLKAECS